MDHDTDAETVVELPDGTTCRVDVKDDHIVYEVEPAAPGQCTQANHYDADDARRQAETIRDREARSWDTVFPEEAGPVLDVAKALDRAATALEEA